MVFYVISSLLIIGGFSIMRKYDAKSTLSFPLGNIIMLAVILIGTVNILIHSYEDSFDHFCLLVFVVYLILCAYTDYQLQQVYRFLHLPAGLFGFLYLYLSGSQMIGSVVFILLQILLFRRFYGMADVYVFSVCALFIGGAYCSLSWTIQLFIFLGHMMLALILLFLFQIPKKNVNWKNGRLKEPVAFVPYIAVAAFVIIILNIYIIDF